MPFRKKISKKTYKPKRTYKKKTTSKKAPRRVDKVQNALIGSQIYSQRLMSTMFDKIYFDWRRVNEFENTTGANVMQYNTGAALGQELPLQMYDLTSIVTDGAAGLPKMTLYTTAAGLPFFVNDALGMTCTGASDGQSFSTAQSINKAMCEYQDVRLELFDRPAIKTIWNLSLVTINDESMHPLFTASATARKHNNFWNQFSRPYYTNTLVPVDKRITDDLKGQYRILWSKTYTMRDRNSDRDDPVRKVVKIFRKVNKVYRYNANPEVKTYGNDDPNELFVPTAAGTTFPHAEQRQRVYLMIRSSCTKDVNLEGAVAADSTSYNMYFKSKYVIPASSGST